jgi:hypothetical protein
MESTEPRELSARELAHALRSVDPRVVLVPARVLRRIVRGTLQIRGFFRHVPHWDGLTIATESALNFAGRDELNLADDAPLPSHLILLAEPELDPVEVIPRDRLILRYWQALFHARVQLALAETEAEGTERARKLEDRIASLGGVEFNEARSVLVEDSFLSVPSDDRSSYLKFAAVYLELHAFRPALLCHTFPAIRDHVAVFESLASDIDIGALLDATRLPEAPSVPVSEAPAIVDVEENLAEEAQSARQGRRWSWLLGRADIASRKGNNVRAAILRSHAARVAPINGRSRTVAGSRTEMEKLARRLKAAIGLSTEEANRWRQVLPAFLDRATCGFWSAEARMLYDLQKVARDAERPIAAIDPIGWIFSLGGRPLRRPMPELTGVKLLQHLHSAGRRARQLRGSEPARKELGSLIARAIENRENLLRVRFRERISATFDQVGLSPTNLPEETSRRKLVEELLDLIVERGYLRIGDLRDAISRNQNKLPDLSGPREFFRGDRLLRADTELARTLDGVYHRGEVYLRFLQRASSLAFGTKLGRWFSRYVALPFGGAFVVLEGLDHLVGPIVHLFGGVAPHFYNTFTHISLALFLLGVLNFPSYRAAFYRSCRGIGRGFSAVFVEMPAWVLDRPLIRTIISSRTFEGVWNWLGKPLLLVLLLHPIIDAFRTDWELRPRGVWTLQAVTFLLMAILVNSRSGRLFEEIATDGATRLGQRLWRDLIPAFFRSIMDFFKIALEAMERLLYTVDEWLRFRSGDGRLTLAGKAVLGLAWAVVAYVARIYVNLLIEPQVNPIKHFPVVTVSHKLMIPASVQIFNVIKTPLLPLGEGIARTIAGTTILLLPGVFGFLVWELKENWRLYAANRPKTLCPTAFGHHGETLSRLLRRGFHSGTIPKLFYRLRKAHRKGLKGQASVEKACTSLHHVEEAVGRFVERGVLYLLERSRSIGSVRPRLGHIHCATNRILVEIREHDDHETAALFAFEELNRRLTLRLIDEGWLGSLDVEQRRVFTTAIIGLCALSDVDLVVDPESGLEREARTLRLTWSNWVNAWEDDIAGRGHPSVVPEGCRLLPARPISETSSGR